MKNVMISMVLSFILLLSFSSVYGQVSEGTYALVARHSGQYLQVHNAEKSGTPDVRTYPDLGNQPHAQWKIKSVGGGYHTLQACHSGQYLQVHNAEKSGTPDVRTYPDLGNQPHAQWKLILIDNAISEPIRKFPLKAKRHDRVPGTNMSMITEITLSQSGSLTCITESWTKVKMRGYTGSVEVVIFASDGRGWISKSMSFGVDGTFFGRSRRKDTWKDSVPSDIARNADKVAIIHSHEPKVKDLFDAILRGIERTVSEAQRLAEAYARLRNDPNVRQAIQDFASATGG